MSQFRFGEAISVALGLSRPCVEKTDATEKLTPASIDLEEAANDTRLQAVMDDVRRQWPSRYYQAALLVR